MFDLMPFESRNRNLARYFDNMENHFFGNFPGWAPEIRTDIIDQGDHFLMQAELPGFSKEEIHLDIDGDRLTLHAEHEENHEEKQENFVRRERSYGSYARSFDISNIKAEEIKASYRDGVLELQLPKRSAAEHGAHQIAIE